MGVWGRWENCCPWNRRRQRRKKRLIVKSLKNDLRGIKQAQINQTPWVTFGEICIVKKLFKGLMFAAAKKRPKVKYFCPRERGQFSLIHLPPYSPRRDNFKEKIGGIEEGHPWHVLLNFGDCKLFNLSAAALFRNRYFRRDFPFFRLRPGICSRRKWRFYQTELPTICTPLYKTNHPQGYKY